MQALAPKLFHAPSAFAKLPKEKLSNVALKIAMLAGALFILYERGSDLSLKDIAVISLLAALAYCVFVKLADSAQIKEIKVLRSLPKLKKHKYASIKGDKVFAISRSLRPDFLKLLELYNNFPPSRELKGSRAAICKTEDKEKYDHRFERLRQTINGIYILSKKNVFSLGFPKNSPYNWDRGVVCSNKFLRSLLLATSKLIPGCTFPVKVQALLSKHATSVPYLAVHRDGFKGWLVQYNIEYSPQGISGGRYQILKDDEVVKEELAVSLLDGYILSDKDFYHSATAIEIEEGSNAHRLIVIFRINFDETIPLKIGRAPPIPEEREL